MQGQVFGADSFVVRHQDRALDDIFKLPYVPFPGIGQKVIQGFGRDRLHAQLPLLAVLADEVVNQQRNVFPAFAEWRAAGAEHVPTEEEGFAGTAPSKKSL